MADLCRDCADTKCGWNNSSHLAGRSCFTKKAEATGDRTPSGQAGFTGCKANGNRIFTEHDDHNGVKMTCFDREYHFGKAVAEKMLTELKDIVDKWGDRP